MKLRNIIALMLVFVLAFGLASCKKQQQQKETKVKENNFEKVSEVKIVDEKGEEHTLATQVNEDTGETEYFYEDNSGNVVTVKAKEADKGGKTEFYVVNNEGEEVTVEATVKEKVVTVPRTRRSEGLAKDAQGATVATSPGSSDPYGDVSLTPEQESFLANFSGDNAEKFVDHNAEKATLALGNNIHKISMDSISDENISADAASRNQGQKFFQDISSKNAYTMKFVMSSTADNQTSSMPVTIAKNGDKMYIEASAPIDISKDSGSMTIKAYINGDKARIYTPNLKAYMDLPSDQVKEFMDEFKLGVEAPEKSNYKGTVKTSIGGKNFEVDVYENDAGTSYYYYDGQNLKRIEHKDKDGTASIIEITQVAYSADSKLFTEPSGYYNMTDLLSQDGMDNWF